MNRFLTISLVLAQSFLCLYFYRENKKHKALIAANSLQAVLNNVSSQIVYSLDKICFYEPLKELDFSPVSSIYPGHSYNPISKTIEQSREYMVGSDHLLSNGDPAMDEFQNFLTKVQSEYHHLNITFAKPIFEKPERKNTLTIRYSWRMPGGIYPSEPE